MTDVLVTPANVPGDALMERIEKRLATIEKQKDEGFYAKAYVQDIRELLTRYETQVNELTAQRDAFGQKAWQYQEKLHAVLKILDEIRGAG
jgi:chromosome segregation ATPase